MYTLEEGVSSISKWILLMYMLEEGVSSVAQCLVRKR